MPKQPLLDDLINLSDLDAVEHIPFGVAPLDALTWGGIPHGYFTLFSGREGSGKSTAAALAIRGFQRMYPNLYTIYVNAENKINPRWAAALGADNSKIKIFYPSYAEEAWGVIKEAVREWNDVGLIVIDSLAALSPQSEAESDPSDQFMAIGARSANRFYRETSSAMCHIMAKEKRKVSIVVINQERESTKILRGDPTILPVGKAQLFFSSLHVRFLTPEVHEEEDKEKKWGLPSYVILKFVIKKNIDGPPRLSSEAKMHITPADGWSVGEFDDLDWVWLWGRTTGVIYKSGGWHAADLLAASKEEMFVKFRSNATAYGKVKEAVLNGFWKLLTETGDGKAV